MTKSWRFLLVATLLVMLSGCMDSEPYQRFSGSTMGTYFGVTCRCSGDQTGAVSGTELEALIVQELARVNAEMSTYDPQSVLSKFNSGSTDVWFDVPDALLDVVSAARELSQLSGGAFDVTVGPLVNAWGFGPDGVPEPPSERELETLRSRVGYQHVHTRNDPSALLKDAEIYVDLSAIAKGHGVDRLAELLRRAGCQDFLVDIGGEVRVRGRNPRGREWRIGVEVPDPSAGGEVQRVLRLTDSAVATSGDYRNFREIDGERLSHTIDPRSGRPVRHALASVTVVHPSAMWADGFATALNVLGPEDALALAGSLDLAALLVIRGPNGFEERYTAAMRDLLVES
jgi:thiamine biosynthesis lipoprotein